MNIQKNIDLKIQSALQPSHFEVLNESYMHSVPENSETHFKLVVVSDAFIGKRKVARHQLIYGLLKEELAGEVHALSMHLYSPEEWQQVTQVAESPNCMGGSQAR